VILGGGRKEFRPTATLDEDGSRGSRTDGVDLIKSWESDKITRNVTYKYVSNRDQLINLDTETTEFVFGE
jgi:Alkaline phosphatase